MLYNVNWQSSQTKQIYNATKSSEELMSYLEKTLMNSGLLKLIGELPVPDKGREYGVMIYYYKSRPKRRLLSAAPRREHDYIHVVIFNGILTRGQLIEGGLETGKAGDPNPDLKLHTKEEINTLVDLLVKSLQNG
ncbi:hypothetical protein J2S09_004122 [Bacillus fengqiuensis]|nr:hypothetical protein [Bacillus fengqiuensis]